MENKRNFLEIPNTARRSVEVINLLREQHLNETLEQTPRPKASSTIEKLKGLESLVDPYYAYNEELLNKDFGTSVTAASIESSLGILDIDKYKGLEDDTSQMRSRATNDMKSISFNPHEMTGRSTHLPPLQEDSKENSNPSYSTNSSGVSKKSICVEDILRDAKLQSQAVDEILKTSNDPTVENIRLSLESYKLSLASSRCKDSWGYRPQDFGTQQGNTSDIRDSMFIPANKMDLSKEELSWIRENGDLPVYHQSTSIDSDKNSSKKFGSQFNETTNDFQSLRSDITNANTSKVSVGNYFQRRSENINRILTAPSPEKTEPHPPLFDPADEATPTPAIQNKMSKVPNKIGETYRKSNILAKELPFLTLSDDSALSDYRQHDQESQVDVAVLTNINNVYHLPTRDTDVCRDLTNTINVNESIGSSPFSLSQIRQFVGKLDTERPSVLLDNMLALNKKKTRQPDNPITVKPDQNLLTIDKNMKNKNNFENSPYQGEGNVSPTLPDKSSFGCVSNIFHSTKHADEILDRDLKTPASNNKTLSYNKKPAISDTENKSPLSKKSLNAGLSSFATSNDDNSSGFVSTLKNYGKSNSGSSGLTESSMKSTNTVLHIKPQMNLRPIDETIRSEAQNKSVNGSNSKENNLQLKSNIPEDLSSSVGRYSSNALTSSDTSRELYNLMSPSSNNVGDYEPITPKSGTQPKRLLDQYQHLNASNNDNGWISPTQVKLNDLSRECVPGQTPFKLDRGDISQGFGTSPQCEYEQLDSGDRSINVPSAGDWIRAESQEEHVFVGISHDLNIKLSSLSSRWISVEFGVNSVFVGGQLYSGDTSDIILLQAPIAKILLNANSQNVCTLKVTALIPNKEFSINLNINLVDVVTKSDSSIEHVIKVHSKLPQLIVKTGKVDEYSPGKGHNLSIDFPIIPEEADMCLPLILCNDSPIDLPISLDIKCARQDIFSIGSITIISRDDVNEILSSPVKLMHKKIIGQRQIKEKILKEFCISKEKQFTMPRDKSNCFKILLYYRAPKLTTKSANIEERREFFEGNLDVSLRSHSQHNPFIPIEKISLFGGVGVSQLAFRSKQKSGILMVNHGCSEDIDMRNTGNIPMQYELFMTTYYDGSDQSVSLLPCENAMFTIDKQTVSLKAGEMTTVRIAYPLGDLATSDMRRTLVFDTPYTTQVLHVVGVPSSRSVSQQSTYSTDSAASQSQDDSVKSTKKELTWGALKLGDANIQDVVFKNPSINRKLRVIASVTGEGFRVIGENGTVPSLMFSLQAQECRTLRVEFRPVRSGSHSGALRITQRTREREGARLLHKVLLHGVGERSALVFRDGVFKHGGVQGLPLGSLSESGVTKDIHFSIWNKGAAPGFVMINLELKWKYRTLSGEVQVIPQRGVVAGGAVLRCVVRVPRRALLLAQGCPGDTETLATLTVLHGDDTTRQRIKRICAEHFKDKSTMDAWNEESQGKLNSLCAHFPEEDPTFGNVNGLKESTTALKVLLDELQQTEVKATYDVDLDSTAAQLASELDETLQFHTMCADSTASTVVSDFA